MELREAIRCRRSIRRFTDKPVSKEQVAELVEAAKLAPSVLNSQPWHFTAVCGEIRDRVVEIVSKSTVYLADVLAMFDPEHRAIAERFICDLGGAPAIIVVSGPKDAEEYGRLTELLSIGCAIENLQLTACDMGLGVCNITFAFWVRDELAELLDLKDREIVSILVVGYPDETPEAPPRLHEGATFLGFEGG